jgi:hypothetical protein
MCATDLHPKPNGAFNPMQTEPLADPHVRRRRLMRVSVVVALVLVVLMLILTVRGSDDVGWAGSVVLGLVEGATEYLPVSSTGHLAVTSLLLWPDATASQRAALDSYVIVIQAGAIAAVFGLYWRRFADILTGIVRGGPGRRLGAGLAIAFLPAAGAGFLWERW